MKGLLTIPLIAFCGLSQALQADNIMPNNPDIRYVGRFDTSNPSAPGMYWSGTHIIAWFEGTSCQVILNCDGGNDYFNILIDDSPPIKVGLVPGSQIINAASGLSDGIHRIEIFKRTSYWNDNTAFQGLITDPAKGLAPLPPEPAVKIEFYGDSITDGHSVDATVNNNAPTFWNNYLTYAAITARNLNMQYVNTSGTGMAVLHPWETGLIMDNYYDTIIPGDRSGSNIWNFSQYQPDIVVVNLLQNDAWLNPSPHSSLEREKILSAYQDLIVKIRTAHPNAEIICALGNMDATRVRSVWPDYIDTVVARIGDSKIRSLFFPFKNSDGHPLAEDQLPMANTLTEFIQNNLAYLFLRDRDGDGMIDTQEVACGTDPNDPNSTFRAWLSEVSSDSEKIRFSWPSRAGGRYRILQSSDLKDWTVIRDWEAAKSPPVESEEFEVSSGESFYRVEAEW